MRTISARELKQNPAEAWRRVLESGEEYVITSHGKSVGVKLVLETSTPTRWVPAAVLAAALPRLSPDDAASLDADIDALRDAEPLRNPWEDGA